MNDQELLKIIKVLSPEEKEELMDILSKMPEGGNLWDVIRDAGSAVAHKVFDLFGVGKKYTRGSRLTVEEFGAQPIKYIMLCKSPVQKFVSMALGAVSEGKFQQEMGKLGYDEMYHLYMLCFLENHKIVAVEKNQTINIQVADESYFDPKSSFEITLSKPLTLGEMLNQTLGYMGTDAYFSYDGKENNCQVYLRSILRANEISNPEAEAFIMQDTRQIFNQLPGYVRDVSRTVTDLGALYDHVKSWLAGGQMQK
jgi:hypothetical protein